MATLSLSGISAVLSVIYADSMADNIRRDVLLPNLLEVANDRNATCVWKGKFSGRNSAAPKAEGFDAVDNDFTSHDRRQLTLTWAEYFAFAKVSGLAQSVNAASAGGNMGMDMDLLAEELGDAIDELAVLLSSDTYGGTVGSSPVEISGLGEAVDATGDYAGLAVATESEHASAENTLATGSLSVDNLRTKLHRPFKDACGMWPEFVVCPGAQWDAVSALFNDQTRQIVDVVTTMARGRVELKAAGGYRAIMVDGIPYIEDRHCTASTFYALHSRYLSYRQVPDANSRFSAENIAGMIKQLTGVTLEVDAVAATLAKGGARMQPYIKLLGPTGDNLKAIVKWYGQLRLTRRNAAAKLLLT